LWREEFELGFRVSGGSTQKGLLWKVGALFGAATAVEALRPWRRSNRWGNQLALVLLGYRGGNTPFPLIFLPTVVHLN